MTGDRWAVDERASASRAKCKADAPKTGTKHARSAKADGKKGPLDGGCKFCGQAVQPRSTTLIAIEQNNPKQPASKSYDRYEMYKAATTLDEMLKLGGTNQDFTHDVKKGFIHVSGGPELFCSVTCRGLFRKRKARQFVSLSVRYRLDIGSIPISYYGSV